MQTYKITIAYDGTAYFGWQMQPQQRTVQQTLQETYARIFAEQITLIGASRTDGGVHALGHVATFDTRRTVEPRKLIEAWNNMLPKDIMIRSIEAVPDSFHPQYCVSSKTYWYHFTLKRPLPFVQRYCWWVMTEPDLQVFEQALSIFKGTHDFRSFCTGDEQENTVRTIEDISLEYIPHLALYRVSVKGPGFLRYMIRRIVGACMDVASRADLSVESLQRVLAEKNPRQALLNAPAQGLVLRKIVYKKDVQHESKSE